MPQIVSQHLVKRHSEKDASQSNDTPWLLFLPSKDHSQNYWILKERCFYPFVYRSLQHNISSYPIDLFSKLIRLYKMICLINLCASIGIPTASS